MAPHPARELTPEEKVYVLSVLERWMRRHTH
jgi:hypothetical protein